MRLDTEDLRTLCTIAECGSISRAAEHLSLSQSGVSHRIKRMETSIGCNLLNRSPGAPLLSNDGQRLLIYARRICALHDEALQTISKQSLAGQIRLGMTEDVTSSDFARVVGRFTRIYPKVAVRTQVKQSMVLQRQLEQGEIDLAMMQIFESELRPNDIVLFRDKVHWVKAKDMKLNLERILPFLAYDDDCFFRHWAMDLQNSPGPGLETVLECASSAGVASAVQSGLGVTLLPHRFLTGEMEVMDDIFSEPPPIAYVLRIGCDTTSAHIQSFSKEMASGITAEVAFSS